MAILAPDSPLSTHGDYRLTGVTDVAELVPIHCLIDRGFPNYEYPAPTHDDATLNYIQFAHSLAKRGSSVQALDVGSARQIVSSAANLLVRNLAANGDVWTGQADGKRKLFPPIATLAPESMPPENTCLIALRVSYGAFTYYTGGGPHQRQKIRDGAMARRGNRCCQGSRAGQFHHPGSSRVFRCDQPGVYPPDASPGRHRPDLARLASSLVGAELGLQQSTLFRRTRRFRDRPSYQPQRLRMHDSPIT